MEFRLLGPLQVSDGDRPVEIAGSKRRAVLALLLLRANEVVRSERLVDELWGEHPPRNAPAALHNHVSRLRKALGQEVLARREWGYVLRADEESIDLRRFERLVAAAEPLPARERSLKLAGALQLWRGPALSDLANEPGLQTEIARLDELRLTTVERRIDADLEAGRNSELVGEIEALIAANPLREHLRSQLILALYRAGRQAEALEVYRETRRVLTEELGLDPSPELRELEKAILRHDPAIAAAVPVSPVEAEPTRSSRRRGVLLAALLALLLTGLGLAAAFALDEHHKAQGAAVGTPVAATTSTSAAATSTPVAATTTTTAHTKTQAVSAETPRKARRDTSTRRHQHPSRHAATQRVAAGSAATHLAARRRGATPATTTTTTNPSRATTQKPRIVTISDNFDGNQIDGTIWYQIHQGSGWPPLSESKGHLELVFPPGTAPGSPYNNYFGHVGTRCQFPGNFDARVDFSLVDWPEANGIVVALQAFFEPNNYGWAGTFRQNSPWGEQYGGLISGGNGASTPLADSSGTFRLVRRNGDITTYFLHNGNWIKLGSDLNRSPVVIVVGAYSATSPPVRKDQVAVDFDNFTVTATNPICPPGAQGPG